MTRVALVVCLLSFVLAATPGYAQQAGDDAAASAQALFAQGVSLARQERWAEAATAFENSFALAPRAASAYNLALACHRAGRYVQAMTAIEAFRGLATDANAQDGAELDRLAEIVGPLIAQVVLTVSPQDAAVSIDGQPLAGEGARRAMWLAAGAHRVHVEAFGHYATELELRTVEGERAERTLTLAAVLPAAGTPVADPLVRAQVRAPAEAHSAPSKRAARDEDGSLLQSPWLWVGAGTVVAAVLVGVLLGSSDDPAQPNGGTTGLVF